MNREDIIRMAREVGIEPSSELLPYLYALCHMAQAAEREACAKVCEAHVGIWIIPAGPQECAAAIRARSSDLLEEAWEQAIK